MFKRIDIYVDVYQIRFYEWKLLYSSSVKCSATIYLKYFSPTNLNKNEPYFLRDYSANIFDEHILKTIPILKVEAVSTNSSIHSPLIYMLSNEREKFIIDSSQGFIYPRFNDLALESGVHTIKVSEII